MNRKLYVISAVLVVFGAIAVIGMKTAPRFYGSELSLPEELASVTEIDVDNSMAIVRRNGVWSSRDDDFYPVDNEKVDTLLEWLRQASLTPSPCEEIPSGAAGVTLKTPSEIRLFYPDGENAAERLTVVFGGQCAVLSGRFDIPAQPYRWFMQPLFPFSDDDIEEIYGAEPGDFSFSGLVFYQVAHDGDFADWDKRKITVVTTGGIVLEMTLYARGHSYWASFAVKPTVMPTVEAAAYLKNNGFLYDGWYFELPQPEGSRLFDSDGYDA